MQGPTCYQDPLELTREKEIIPTSPFCQRNYLLEQLRSQKKTKDAYSKNVTMLALLDILGGTIRSHLLDANIPGQG